MRKFDAGQVGGFDLAVTVKESIKILLEMLRRLWWLKLRLELTRFLKISPEADFSGLKWKWSLLHICWPMQNGTYKICMKIPEVLTMLILILYKWDLDELNYSEGLLLLEYDLQLSTSANHTTDVLLDILRHVYFHTQIVNHAALHLFHAACYSRAKM